ncbi:hypothetical protein N7493_009271 [Penicillium malachiteum]|uniref:Uncharacterized protein n=1 Tax=Penicillium malachiteum TaxID=1324776 RepID=A0AAD6MTA9_9EURO|nr:hypothetical protein N7493_009271 [Penicillium malachiteum]
MPQPVTQTHNDLSEPSLHALPATTTTMTNLDIQVDGQTKEALKTDLTLRCLIKTKYERDKSRASAVVIAWAQFLAERLSTNILQNVEQQTSGFSVELDMIQVLRTRSLFISFDIFLDECDKNLRSNIQNSFDLKRPVFQIVQKGTSCFVFRNPKADAEVTKEYTGFSEKNK